MNVRNCKKCGRIFNYVSGPGICPSCREAMEDKFQEVKKYVREHRNATMQEISEECEVDAAQIKQWIREERLEFSDDSPIKLSCEGCGALINSGRFCSKCKSDMASNLSGAIRKPEAPVKQPVKQDSTKNKMRFLDK